ncbi:amidase [Labrys okinawensis]|uniref:amidase n=1 Tax=Labrys okinawensis TaxID=346911 RepID=UPI0039BCF1B4
MAEPESAVALSEAVKRGEASALSAVETCLARSQAVQPRLNCFTEIYADQARAEATRIDALPLAGRADLPLCGVPIAIKDFTPLAGKRTTFGSKVYRDHIAEHDPVIVRRLKAAGAIILGHTTTPEFAYSGSTHSPLWGITRNPWNPERTSGGSSGGSAVAVATGGVFLAEGTDMGGSIRIPASLCGVVGLKPSFGRIPMDILRTQYDTLAHFGPLARSVDDAALFLSVCEGPDDADALSLPKLPTAYPVAKPPRRPKFAVSLDLDMHVVSDEVAGLFHALITDIEKAGAEIAWVRTPFTVQAAKDWYALWAYCFAGDVGHLLEGHRDKLDSEVVGLIEKGRRLDIIGLRAIEHRRTALWREFAKLLQGYDALLCPTTAVTAPPADPELQESDEIQPDGRYSSVDMTGHFNLLSSCPVLSLPMGLAGNGMPAGLQIVGHRHGDRGVLALGKWIEALRTPQFPPFPA